MPRCLISFGANLGNARETIQRAANQLKDKLTTAIDLFQLSPLYKTPPVGGPSGQPPFLNAVAAVETQLSPWEVWHAVRDVEQQLGRERFQRWEARRIDLDILLFDDARIWTPQLKIPHPRMCMRRFILAPAAQVARDWLDPVTGQSIGSLARALEQGRGSLMLCTEPKARPELLLEEVARHTLAKWQTVDFGQTTTQEASDNTSRWVALAPQQLASLHAALPTRAEEAADVSGVRLSPPPKLVVFLVDVQASSGAQWEDRYRGLARLLNLSSGVAADQPFTRRWSSQTPRYLLATDDRHWAVHELVAALEAMDCPVEQLRE